MSELLHHVRWQDYAPGIKYRAVALLKRAERTLKRCTLCNRPKQTVHAFIPDAAKNIGGDEAPIRPYALCKGCADAELPRILQALGIRPEESTPCD